VAEQFAAGRVSLHAMLARVGCVDRVVGVDGEIHHAVRDQQAVHPVVFADVVDEFAAAVEAPDRAVRGVSGQHAVLGEADRRHAPQQSFVAPGVDEFSRRRRKSQSAGFGRRKPRHRRPPPESTGLGSPSLLQAAGGIEDLDLGIVGGIELPVRVNRDAAQRAAN
jgi:hypothetical protein